MASLLEIAALALVAKAVSGSRSAPAAPAAPPAQPQGGVNVGQLGGAVGGSLVTLAGGLVSAIGGGGTVTTAVGTGVGSSVGGAAVTGAEVGAEVAEYSIIGSFSAGSIAGTAAAVAYIVGIIVASAVAAAVEQYHAQVRQLLGYDIRAGSWGGQLGYFNALGVDTQHCVQQLLRTALVDSTKIISAAQYKSRLPPAVLQKAVATCIAMGFERAEARNTALANFFSHLGESPDVTFNTGAAIPPAQLDQFFFTPYLQGGEGTGNPAGNPLGLTGPFARHSINNAGAEAITGSELCTIPVWTRTQVHDIALELLGQANYETCARVMRFLGSSYGVLLGSIAGYTTFWPGDPEFVHGINDRTVNGRWTVVQGVQLVPTSPAEQLDTIWLQDPDTGFLIAPITSRERTALIISPGGAK